MTQLAFIGAGSMGSALIEGLLAGGHPVDGIAATTGSAASAQALHDRLGVQAVALADDADANRRLAADADIVVLGVKPWMIRETLAGLGPLSADQVLVSVAAGITIQTLRELSGEAPVVRLMPNTPTAIGLGASSLSIADDPSPAEEAAANRVTDLFAPTGVIVRLPEDQIPAMTGVAGSGTAYFYHLAEVLIEAGVQEGLDRETAVRLVHATAHGAGAMLAHGADDAGTLRGKVTSKGGTTAAALAVFAEAGFPEVAHRAVKAAADRAREMAAE